jgi:hypothetical protein
MEYLDVTTRSGAVMRHRNEPVRLALPSTSLTNFQRRSHVEVKIGIKDTPRELVVSSGQSPEEVEKLVAEALTAGDGLFRISDEKGRKYIVPSDRIAYVEIAPSDVRKVGFGVGD